MQWSRPGHELDEEAERIKQRFEENGRKIYVFGAGILGKDIRQRLELFGCFGGFIDNDEEKQKNGVDGIPVMSFREYMALSKKGILVLAADLKNIPALSRQVSEAGLAAPADRYLWTDFIRRIYPILSVYCFDRAYVELAQISVTERCTLKCRKCAHACPYDKNRMMDLSLEDVFLSADSFFSRVDIVREFVLIGGEPLLYKDLADAVAYIGERYRQKIITFSIATNGTIVPSDELLEQCIRYGVVFKISNYSASVPRLIPIYERVEQALEKSGALYEMGSPEIEWFDYGFEQADRSDASKADMIKLFDSCKTSCREVRRNRYHYCVMARSVSENMGFDVGKDDHLDLAGLPDKDHKKILLEFELGYSEKGYLDMCRHCNGAAAAKKKRIPAAEQMP